MGLTFSWQKKINFLFNANNNSFTESRPYNSSENIKGTKKYLFNK